MPGLVETGGRGFDSHTRGRRGQGAKAQWKPQVAPFDSGPRRQIFQQRAEQMTQRERAKHLLKWLVRIDREVMGELKEILAENQNGGDGSFTERSWLYARDAVSAVDALYKYQDTLELRRS